MLIRWGKVIGLVFALSFLISLFELALQTFSSDTVDARLVLGILVFVLFSAGGWIGGDLLLGFIAAPVVELADARLCKLRQALDGLNLHEQTRLSVLESETVSAFSVSSWRGQHTILTTTLVAQLSPLALRGVVAHELQHAIHQHSRRGIVLMALVLSVKFTLGIPALVVPGVILGMLWVLRQWEYEADYQAARSTSPDTLIAALQEMKSLDLGWQSRLPEWLFAFPAWEKRIANVKNIYAIHENRV